jgi:competence ComEA-like helix-hairpin-helix protein
MNRSALALVAALVCFTPWSAEAQRASKPPVAAPAEVINLNTGTAAQIASLPGIASKRPSSSCSNREKNGPYKKIEEIMNVRGIGEKSFLRIKDRLTVAQPKSEK